MNSERGVLGKECSLSALIAGGESLIRQSLSTESVLNMRASLNEKLQE